MKPPVYRFCWWCSRQLYGGSHRIAQVYGHDVRLHAACVKNMMQRGETVSFIRSNKVTE